MTATFKSIYDRVLSILNNKLPKYLTYHSIDHTLYVLDRAIYIGEKENITKKEMTLLKVAVLFHDIGFIESHIEHEELGCDIAKKELKNFNFSKEEIDKICGMIMATRIPQNPKNLTEKIIADADLEYLSTNHFHAKGEKLYKELKYFNKDLTYKEWNSIQIKFLNAHNYHTNYCKRYKEFRKNKNLNTLK